MKKDELHLIFRQQLKKMDPETQGVEDLVYEVVGTYMAKLLERGNIPQYLMDTVESDLREEVLEMYRKTTYGFLNLKEYLLSAKFKNSKRVS
jgi:hypothetical protein